MSSTDIPENVTPELLAEIKQILADNGIDYQEAVDNGLWAFFHFFVMFDGHIEIPEWANKGR